VDTNVTRGEPQAFKELFHWITDAVDKAGGINEALTVGVPNTGKSSVLQSLLRFAKNENLIPKQTKAVIQTGSGSTRKKKTKKRMGKAAVPEVQDVPGKTRRITEYLLRENPKMYFLDVPGMTPPHFFFEERPEAWFGFGAANLLIPGHSEDPALLPRAFCDYVLYCANRDGVFDYVKKLNLTEPTQDIDVALGQLSNKYQGRMDESKLTIKRSETFLKLFNTGNFGPIVLDDLRERYRAFQFRETHFQEDQRAKQRFLDEHRGPRYDDLDDSDDEW
jgi:ribosome biogenesis GTPase A